LGMRVVITLRWAASEARYIDRRQETEAGGRLPYHPAHLRKRVVWRHAKARVVAT
jgi:hypothetical protein